MRYLIVIGILFLSCCAPLRHPHRMIFAPGTYLYVQRFFAYGYATGRLTAQIDDLVVVFMPQQAPGVGRCIQGGDNTPVIQLDPAWWDKFDDMDREQLIFHELGHCILNRVHVPTFVTFGNDTIPQSIMYPIHFSESIYMKYHMYYILELFSE